MQITLANTFLSLTMDSFGAQWMSLKDSKGCERLWQGDDAWWGRRAPVLFPIVGKLYEDSFRHAGISYAMSQHGFARDSQWKLRAHTPESCCFMLEASATTHENYPFAYRLEIETQLKKNTILTQYRLTNPDSAQTLYASIGAHPAFRLQEAVNYQLSLSSHATLEQWYLAPPYWSGIVHSHPCVNYRLNQSFMTILETEDTLIYHANTGEIIAELLGDNGEKVICESKDLPFLGIWSPVKEQQMAPFICLEPWQGIADREGFTGELKDKMGILAVAPNQCWTGSWQVKIKSADK